MLYALTVQDHLYGDGSLLVKMASRDTWHLNKVLYPPLARLSRWVCAAVGIDGARASLEALSVTASALSGGLTFVGARRLGCSRAAALAGSLLAALSPTVWFFATAVEVHAVQLVVAAGFVAWLASAYRRGRLGRSALPIAGWTIALCASHPTGALWIPAAGGFVALERWRSRSRGLLVAGLLLAGFCVIVFAALGNYQLTGIYADFWSRALRRPLTRTAAFLGHELAFGAGLLLVPPLVFSTRRPWRAGGSARRLAWGAALLFGAFLIVVPSYHCLRARGLLRQPLSRARPGLGPRHRRDGTPVAPARLPLRRPAGHARLAADPGLPDAVRAPGLARGAGAGHGRPGGRFRELDRGGGPIARFTSMPVYVISPYVVEIGPEQVIDWTAQHDARLVIMRSLLEQPDDPRRARYVEDLIGMLGEPVEGSRSEYLLFRDSE